MPEAKHTPRGDKDVDPGYPACGAPICKMRRRRGL